MAKVKGTALMPRLKYMEEQARPGVKERVLSELSEAFQTDIKKGIFVGQWYPFDYYLEINRALDKIMGIGDHSLIPKLGAYSAEQGLKGVYKFFYKVGSPEFIIMRAAKVWNQYFVNGTLTAEKAEATAGRKAVSLKLIDVEIPTEEHCLSVLGWVKRTLELSGGKKLRADLVKCRRKNAPYCEILATWE